MNPASDLHAESTLHRPAPAYKWWVVGMLWFICCFNYADRQAIYSVFPKLKEEFGFDNVRLGLIGSAFMWVYAAGAPLAGFVGDRTRRKDLILGRLPVLELRDRDDRLVRETLALRHRSRS